MPTILIWILVGLCVFGLIVYGLFMIFLPEWVGITGKVAKKNESDHKGDAETSSRLPPKN